MKMEKRTNKGSRDVIHHCNDNIAPVKEQEARKIKKKEDNLVSNIDASCFLFQISMLKNAMIHLIKEMMNTNHNNPWKKMVLRRNNNDKNR